MHILDRLRVFIGGKPDSEILEGGLILVVLISIASVGPAVWSQNAELVREQTVQLMLAAIATALCLVERSYAAAAKNRQTRLEPSRARRAARPGSRRCAKGARFKSSISSFAVARP